MAWYQKADDELYNEVASVMRQYHLPLVDSGVHVDVIVARSEDTPPIVVRGIECAATVRITSTRERALGIGDAVITINGELMPTWSTRQLHAVIDHELTHLELKMDKKTGQPKVDDQDRPMLKIRLHDREFGWFDCVATRWGADSFENSQARELIESATWVQTLLPGFEPEVVYSVPAVVDAIMDDFAERSAEHFRKKDKLRHELKKLSKPKAKPGKLSPAVVPPSSEPYNLELAS
jgi:hypothetical protein